MGLHALSADRHRRCSSDITNEAGTRAAASGWYSPDRPSCADELGDILRRLSLRSQPKQDGWQERCAELTFSTWRLKILGLEKGLAHVYGYSSIPDEHQCVVL